MDRSELRVHSTVKRENALLRGGKLNFGNLEVKSCSLSSDALRPLQELKGLYAHLYNFCTMANEKRDASPDASRSGAETPSKRPRLDKPADALPEGPAAAAAAAAQSSAGVEAAQAAEKAEVPSSPAPARETDSPSSRGKQRGGGRGGRGGGARGGRGDKGAGKQGPKSRTRDRNDAPREGSRNAETAAKAAAADASGAASTGAGTAEDDKRDKLPKKKVAVLIGYSGLGYKGSQMYVVPLPALASAQ